jgi:hypothetical protein
MMDRRHEEWTDRFSDYLSDDLDPEARALVDAHVAECLPCRDVLAELSAVVDAAKRAGDLQTPRDLWPGLADAIGAASSAAGNQDVIELPTARRHPVGAPASRVRLAAAAVLLVTVSAGTAWWAASRSLALEVDAVQDPSVAGGAVVGGAGAGDALATGDTGMPNALSAQLRVLEDVLAAARATLDPATVLVLERNLNVVEAAIADSREALAADPGNAFLMEHLERMYRRKLIYMQDAVRVAEWAS